MPSILSSFAAYTCSLLPSILNGVINYSPDTTSPFDFGTTATYSCNEGFYLSVVSSRTCTGSGLSGFWDGMEPQCLGRIALAYIFFNK